MHLIISRHLDVSLVRTSESILWYGLSSVKQIKLCDCIYIKRCPWVNGLASLGCSSAFILSMACYQLIDSLQVIVCSHWSWTPPSSCVLCNGHDGYHHYLWVFLLPCSFKWLPSSTAPLFQMTGPIHQAIVACYEEIAWCLSWLFSIYLQLFITSSGAEQILDWASRKFWKCRLRSYITCLVSRAD